MRGVKYALVWGAKGTPPLKMTERSLNQIRPILQSHAVEEARAHRHSDLIRMISKIFSMRTPIAID